MCYQCPTGGTNLLPLCHHWYICCNHCVPTDLSCCQCVTSVYEQSQICCHCDTKGDFLMPLWFPLCCHCVASVLALCCQCVSSGVILVRACMMGEICCHCVATGTFVVTTVLPLILLVVSVLPVFTWSDKFVATVSPLVHLL